MKTTLDWAVEYRSLGWSIIPLVANTKRPNSGVLRECGGTGEWKKFQKSPPSVDEIAAWFEVDPTCGIGVVMGEVSGVVVADFDRGEWPEIETPMVRTSRGVHLYLAASGEVPGRGLLWGELKGEGGMVVAPPSVHESGHVYEWLVAPQTGLLALEDVIDQLQIPPKGSARKVSTATRSRLRVVPSKNVPLLRLTPEESEYLRLRPAKGQRRSLGFGEIEHGIICSMANQGYSASEILAWFVAEKPPKFEERGMEWLMFSIENAIATSGAVSVSGSDNRSDSSCTPYSSLCRETGHIDQWGEDDSEDESAKRPSGWEIRRWRILRDGPENVRVGEFETYIRETFQVGRTQATEDLAWLFAKGWLTRSRSDADGRVKIVVRTEKARERLASWHGIGTPLPFLRGLPRVTAPGGPGVPVAERPAAVAVQKLQDNASKPAAVAVEPESDPVAARRAARAAEERRRERGLINDIFRIHFGGHPTYIQLLTHPENSLAALFQEQLRVGYDGSGLTVRRSFISPRDPSLGGPGALDPITDRVLRDGGYPPAEKLFAWAVQLRKTKTGFEVATHIENGQAVDNVGLIVQAPTNFYLHLMGIPDVTSRVIKVVRKTAKKKVKNGVEKKIDYRCEAIGDALPVSYELPDLETVLNEIADEEFAHEILDSLAADWRLVKKLPWWMNDLPPAARKSCLGQ